MPEAKDFAKRPRFFRGLFRTQRKDAADEDGMTVLVLPHLCNKGNKTQQKTCPCAMTKLPFRGRLKMVQQGKTAGKATASCGDMSAASETAAGITGKPFRRKPARNTLLQNMTEQNCRKRS